MPTRKNIEDKEELATPQNANSPQQTIIGGGGLRLVCVGFTEGTQTNPTEIYAGLKLQLKAVLDTKNPGDYIFSWTTDQGSFELNGALIGNHTNPNTDAGDTIRLATNGISVATPVTFAVTVIATPKIGGGAIFDVAELPTLTAQNIFRIRQPQVSDLKQNFDEKMDQLASNLQGVDSRLQSGINVSLQRSAIGATSDLPLWVVIRESTRGISFDNYLRFVDLVLCGETIPTGPGKQAYDSLRRKRFLPFNDTDAYRLLKAATEAFLLVNGGVGGTSLGSFVFTNVDLSGIDGIQFNPADLETSWRQYLVDVNGDTDLTIPYLSLIRTKLADQPLINRIFWEDETIRTARDACDGVLRNKLSQPFLTELIWSYWQEEGMLVQTLNAISRRFQNVRNPRGERDPLAMLEIDPLRPLNNLLWGYIQDEQHRLSVVRRAYEYDHHYGFSIEGRAVPHLRTADSRSKFLEAFHQLLHLSNLFFKQDDDTTVRADGFPILNALREVHLILSQGAHNQFGDLPSTARQEMLMQQFLLARPEFREFLPTRVMVAYPEPWMDRVDAMKTLQGWTDTSILHFNNLAIYAEQLLLSIRYGAWSQPDITAAQAAIWARFWRSQIQSYIHSYRAATGIDLAATARGSQVDSTPPSVHLRNRLARRA